MNQSQAEAAASPLRDALKAMFGDEFSDVDIKVIDNRTIDRGEAEADTAFFGEAANPDPRQTILNVLTLPLSGPQKLALVGLCAAEHVRMNNERAAFLFGGSVEEWSEVMHQLAGLGYVMKVDDRILINMNCIATNSRALPDAVCTCGEHH